ncbi:MAG TPA: HAD family hydrolase [Gemmataceae bacterium]|nr:HAD family hydrolase [Gemmataceae bacterium]
MGLTLQQYADYLDTRDLTWPAPPEIERPKAKPHLVHLPEVRAVTWSIYGTLLAISGGELYFEHPNRFVMDVALDKTIQEFKMWAAMSRKPGHPAEYLRKVYKELLVDQRIAPSPGEKYPEIQADRLWEVWVKRLLQKEYKIDAGFYGALNEFSRKVAYFFHASLQGTTCYPEAAEALLHVNKAGLTQGLLADSQCFTLVQLERGLARQEPQTRLDDLLGPELRVCSHEVRARKPSERLYRHMLCQLAKLNIAPGQVLHIGSRVALDVMPARRLGMKTGLFAGDLASLDATSEQMKDPASRPDVLLTKLSQIAEVLG